MNRPHCRSVFFRIVWTLVILPAASGTIALAMAGNAQAADQPQWGERFTRNMISDETGLPADFDPETGKNIKWSAELGTKNYSSPIVVQGCVFIGANNAYPRDPRHEGDRAILRCLDESDGSLRWDLVCPRLRWDGDIYLDWPQISMCSPPTVEGDRVYTVTNRFEVVCLDLAGMRNGNDGPFTDEGQHMVPPGDKPVELKPTDADIIWLFDLPSQVGIYPHDGAHMSILLDGRYLYLNSGNGVDNTHRVIRQPDAPSLVVLDKQTGELVAYDDEHIGPRIFHSTWSSPALGVIDDVRQIVFCGGDGVVYGFRALRQDDEITQPKTLERIWKFDPDPDAPKENVHEYVRNRRESPSNIFSPPVLHDGRLYITGGGDLWWGKEEAWLKCIDPRGSGDLTDTAEVWTYPLEKHTMATPAIWNGLVFVVDFGRNVHCVDARTGEAHWIHRMRGDTLGSTLVADGKVYVGSSRGDFYILAADKEKQVLAEIELGSPVNSTPTAANGVLYVPSMTHLYAVEEQSP